MEFYASAQGRFIQFVITAEALSMLDGASAIDCDPATGFDAYFRNEERAHHIASTIFARGDQRPADLVITPATLNESRRAG